MKFNVIHTDTSCQARAGILDTSHGQIETPIFMPVGTRAAVKGLTQFDLEEHVRAQIILANTYHLYLRPGIKVIEKAGGIHKFMNWSGPILTDSGGYQVYSLSSMRKIKEEGASFSSHIDGSKHFFSPESIMDIQKSIGADIIMAFDECTPYPCDYNYAKNSLGLTHRWLDRCFAHFDNSPAIHNYPQILAPIVQGSTYEDLRIESCKYISDKNAEINAIGGLSVGEPHNEMYDMAGVCTNILPKDKARYLMGVGLPENILECISLGIDMFDCVLPSRNARHGILYTTGGVIHIKNAKWKEDFSPIDPSSDSLYSQNYSKAYLRHLFQVKEILASQIATAHNLRFYLWLVETAREKIINNTFDNWKTTMIPKLTFRL
ncbi:MAG: tRNA guanosine(34) transglycosylase Tgt [Saprospiraceae bacterium]|nr:tRNA guanosine(34) transglycosylase Tgt [Bacteroidia bacterium]NNF20339.1 tRNA guanosine(34) transglycosylase Tgt [Saprospiraceae bacterium]